MTDRPEAVSSLTCHHEEQVHPFFLFSETSDFFVENNTKAAEQVNSRHCI